MSEAWDENCPVCGGEIEAMRLALCNRDDDGSRTCKTVLRCSVHSHITWRWADRPDTLLERDDSLALVFGP